METEHGMRLVGQRRRNPDPESWSNPLTRIIHKVFATPGGHPTQGDLERRWSRTDLLRDKAPFPPTASERLRHRSDEMASAVNRCWWRTAVGPGDAGQSSGIVPDRANWRRVPRSHDERFGVHGQRP